MRKILSLVFAALIILSTLTIIPVSAEETDGKAYTYSDTDFTNYDYSVYDPIPLLVLVVSFDANGNGIDDAKAGVSTTSKSSGCYGEQWAYTKESYWANEFFGETGKTLNNFYKYNSDGKFYWIPVEENYGDANNGVIYVTVNCQHPYVATGKNTGSGNEKTLAIKEAAKYMDFEKYDKDGNGALDYTELTISFIIAGYNTKFTSSATTNQKFGLHNFMLATGSGVQIGKVVVMSGSQGARFTYDGECMANNTGIKFGSPAHELGHVLGARDLYTASGYTWVGGPGDIALNGGGSYLSYSGESKGSSPAAIEPYYQTAYGFRNPTVATDGFYTLYSKESKKGTYNIIRVNTADPREYYLIENRYYAGTDTYDAIQTSAKAIQIWHVDETIISSYTWPNCYSGSVPHNPGLTPLYPNGATGGSGYNGWDKTDGVFDCTQYKFAGTGTWYSLMSDEEAEKLHFTLEVTSNLGTEMTVKISGTTAYAPFFTCNSKNDSTDSVTIVGQITSLNNTILKNLKCEISKSTDFSTLEGTKYAKPDSAGQFSFTIDGLSPKTNYYYRVTATSDNGDSVRNGAAITKAVPKVRTDDFMVYFYQFKTAANRPYEKVVKIGNEVTYSFPMTMSTQKFAGWYYEMAYINKFDMATIKTTTDDLYLYAKWIPNEEAVYFTLVDAKPIYEVYAYGVGEAVDVPRVEAREGYELEGWYLDPEYTEEFDFANGYGTAGEVKLYAKWVSTNPVETTEPETTTEVTPVETTTNAEIETKELEATTTSGGNTEKKGSPVVIIIIVAAVVVAVVVVVVIVSKKKKN